MNAIEIQLLNSRINLLQYDSTSDKIKEGVGFMTFQQINELYLENPEFLKKTKVV